MATMCSPLDQSLEASASGENLISTASARLLLHTQTGCMPHISHVIDPTHQAHRYCTHAHTPHIHICTTHVPTTHTYMYHPHHVHITLMHKPHIHICFMYVPHTACVVCMCICATHECHTQMNHMHIIHMHICITVHTSHIYHRHIPQICTGTYHPHIP